MKPQKINTISKSGFKAHALELFRKIQSDGKPIVITDHGRPALEIRKYRKKNPISPLELLRGSVLRFDQPLDPVGEDDWQVFK